MMKISSYYKLTVVKLKRSGSLIRFGQVVHLCAAVDPYVGRMCCTTSMERCATLVTIMGIYSCTQVHNLNKPNSRIKLPDR